MLLLVGAYFQEQLKSRFSHDCFVAQVRGEGMIAAVQLVKDKADKTFFGKEVKISAKVAQKCYENGLISRPLPSLDSMAFSPPLVCTTDDIDNIVNIFDASVRSVMSEVL